MMFLVYVGHFSGSMLIVQGVCLYCFLVGGWTNPSEKYESNWKSSPNFRDENKKYLSCHHLACHWHVNLRSPEMDVWWFPTTSSQLKVWFIIQQNHRKITPLSHRFTSGAPLESIKATCGIETLSQEVMPWTVRDASNARREKPQKKRPGRMEFLDHQKRFRDRILEVQGRYLKFCEIKGVGLCLHKPYSYSL